MKALAFRFAGGVFTIRLWPTLISLVMLVGLVLLGLWQVDRLHWKIGLLEEIKERMQEPEIDIGLSQILPETMPSLDFHPGAATGVFQNDKPLYMNATRIGNGEGGYHILTPMLLDNGTYLLIDRGWIPYALKDKPDGADTADSLYRPAGTVHLTGILRLAPKEKPNFRPDNDPGKNSWYWIDLPAMASATGVKEFLPLILEADDAPHDGSYPIGGQTRVDLPNHHFQYAMTWFWLAFILPFIYAASSWKRVIAKKTETEEKAE